MSKFIFSSRLKELREYKGISQTKLGEILGFSQAYISKWEKGLGSPNIEDLVKIATFFNVSTDYLLGLTDL